jgi:hypothetical protein
MTKPISPKEALKAHVTGIPDAVFDVVNTLLAARINDNDSTINITQEEVVAELTRKGHSLTEIFEKGWLDFETIYQKQGWTVKYDKPGYNETYDAFWVFSYKGVR